MSRDLARTHVELNGADLAYVDVGVGPPVLLLHGFPDSADLWRQQVPALVAAGRRVIAPDLRGFGESAQPVDLVGSNVLTWAGDAGALLDHLGIGQAAVVGHDFGAALGWVLASFGPDRVERLVCVSVGHPACFAAAGIGQRRLSFYMSIFQFEGIAEQWLSADDWANFRAWVTFAGHQAPDLERWIADLSRPGALTAALGAYRSNVPPASLVAPRLEAPPITCDTMGIMGLDDFALLEAQMTGSSEYVQGAWRYEALPGVGHWIPVEAPDRLNELLVDFLSG